MLDENDEEFDFRIALSNHHADDIYKIVSP